MTWLQSVYGIQWLSMWMLESWLKPSLVFSSGVAFFKSLPEFQVFIYTTGVVKVFYLAPCLFVCIEGEMYIVTIMCYWVWYPAHCEIKNVSVVNYPVVEVSVPFSSYLLLASLSSFLGFCLQFSLPLFWATIPYSFLKMGRGGSPSEKPCVTVLTFSLLSSNVPSNCTVNKLLG